MEDNVLGYDAAGNPSKHLSGDWSLDFPQEDMEADFVLAMKSLDDLKKLQDEINEKELNFVKENINYSDLEMELEGFDWCHVGYVEVEKTDYKNGFYPSYDFYVEKGGDKRFNYMRQDDDGEYHNLVWQTVGCCEDDYSGYLLFPLKDGRYWKISYQC